MFCSNILVRIYCFLFFFFFKQKTAYEMRISDWSSDVCSSDLGHHARVGLVGLQHDVEHGRDGTEGGRDGSVGGDDGELHIGGSQRRSGVEAEDRKSVV